MRFSFRFAFVVTVALTGRTGPCPSVHRRGPDSWQCFSPANQGHPISLGCWEDGMRLLRAQGSGALEVVCPSCASPFCGANTGSIPVCVCVCVSVCVRLSRPFSGVFVDLSAHLDLQWGPI